MLRDSIDPLSTPRKSAGSFAAYMPVSQAQSLEAGEGIRGSIALQGMCSRRIHRSRLLIPGRRQIGGLTVSGGETNARLAGKITGLIYWRIGGTWEAMISNRLNRPFFSSLCDVVKLQLRATETLRRI
jgi:hypothetical protein